MADRTHELSVEISALLLKFNPMRFTPPSDKEYWPEAREIGPLLEKCRSDSDVTDVVYAVFKKFFTLPYDAGDRSRYEAVGQEIWKCWQRMKTEPIVDHSSELLMSGDFKAMLDRGVALINGDGFPRNFEEGRKLVTYAAQKDYIDAQFVLGTMYDDGVGVSSIKDAQAWYERAATKGHRRAQYRLGVLLAQPSVIQNLSEAVAWIEKAALQEHPGAQRDLGLMYRRGDGVAQDLDKAREWLAKAAAQGDTQARNALSDLPERAAAARGLRDRETAPPAAKSTAASSVHRDVERPARSWKFWK